MRKRLAVLFEAPPRIAIPDAESSISPETSTLAPSSATSEAGESVPIPISLFESTSNPEPPTVRSDENRFVELAVVEKRLVVVA